MKQECTLVNLYVSWGLYIAGLLFLALQANWLGLLLWLILLPVTKWAYVRYFPRIANRIGYGWLDDKLPDAVKRARVEVTFYGALGCPFCPVVEQRLDALQKEMDFDLRKIDVTLKPQLLARKVIRSVPVVEAGQNRLVGHATTEQLAGLIEAALAGEMR